MSRAAVRRNPNHGMLMLGDGQEGAVTASASAGSVRPPRHRGASPSRAARPRNRKNIHPPPRSEEHTYEHQSLIRISYAVFCMKKKTSINEHNSTRIIIMKNQ